MEKIFLFFSILSIISIVYSVEITESGVLFEYEDENAQSVFLVGSMNNWNTAATPMEKDENGILLRDKLGNLEKINYDNLE